MPHSKLHKRQKAKNYTLLVALLVLVAIFFTLAIIKLKIA